MKICPQCAYLLDDQDRRCPHCHHTPGQGQDAASTDEHHPVWGIASLAGLAAIVLLVAFLVFRGATGTLRAREEAPSESYGMRYTTPSGATYIVVKAPRTSPSQSIVSGKPSASRVNTHPQGDRPISPAPVRRQVTYKSVVSTAKPSATLTRPKRRADRQEMYAIVDERVTKRGKGWHVQGRVHYTAAKSLQWLQLTFVYKDSNRVALGEVTVTLNDLEQGRKYPFEMEIPDPRAHTYAVRQYHSSASAFPGWRRVADTPGR